MAICCRKHMAVGAQVELADVEAPAHLVIEPYDAGTCDFCPKPSAYKVYWEPWAPTPP